jgi:transcriptional regulator with XRE-family HTH domain
MTIEVHEYATEGHRLLVESPLSPSELSAKSGLPRPRISEWRSGKTRPNAEARRALEAAPGIGIPVGAWDAPPTAKPKGEAVPADAAPIDVPGLSSASSGELEAFGVDGLEGVIGRLRLMAADLPPRERVQAVATEGRLHQALAGLRAREADARLEYLASAEFQTDVRLLCAAVPSSAGELRARLARFGIELPAPTVATVETARPPPRTKADVETIVRELELAAGWRAKGETMLAAGHVLSLCIDVHSAEISEVIAAHPDLAGRFLGLLEPADEKIVSSALERRMALADALRLPVEARRVVVGLLEAHGLVDVAAEIRGAA